MPVDLTNLSKQSNNTTIVSFTPKWFHADLTGSGGKAGLLNNQITLDSHKNSANIRMVSLASYDNSTKKSWSQGDISYRKLPLSLYSYDLCNGFNRLPKFGDTTDISAAKDNSISIAIDPLTIVVVKNEPQRSKELLVTYNIRVYAQKDATDNTFKFNPAFNSIANNPITENEVCVRDTNDIRNTIEGMLCFISDKVDYTTVDNLLNKTTLYSLICNMSEKWNTTLNEEIEGIIDMMDAGHTNSRYSAEKDIIKWFNRIEQYPVPLSIYNKMYQKLKASKIGAKTKTLICCANLNMLMHEKMDILNKNKKKLAFVKKTKPICPTLASYSHEQQAAILSESPLTLIQAGAGCGKSSTLLGRMEHMFHEGVDPKKTLILTFTNAAADNIISKQPLVRSSTIASLIHEVYNVNFPSHQLSNLDTIINSLEIYFDLNINTIAKELQNRLLKFRETNLGQSVFTEANLFLSENFDAVLSILNQLKQTCLELEILIMYQMVDTFVEPNGLNPTHIIMDEVQDTSIFEFVFILSYALRKKSSVYLVGDAAQTLYEFRHSNPKALSVLETSGIFDIYALSTNYRSNQAILDFANVALKDIEANAQAQIQLKANCFSVGVPFNEKVKFIYHQQDKRTNIIDDLCDKMATEINYWATPFVEAGEQVAFIAHSRRAALAIEKCLKMIFPNKTVNNLVPEKPYANTLFSKYIMKYWNEARFFNPTIFMDELEKAMQGHIGWLTWNKNAAQKASANLTQDIADIKLVHKNTIAAMQLELKNGKITKHAFLDGIKGLLLDYEIKKNATKFRVIQSKNSEVKQHTDGDLVVSTIHSVKGLEFPHVCVIYTGGNNPDEASKRMYYVAFTRAIQNTLIASFDTEQFSALEIIYDNLVKQLATNPIYQSATSTDADVA